MGFVLSGLQERRSAYAALSLAILSCSSLRSVVRLLSRLDGQSSQSPLRLTLHVDGGAVWVQSEQRLQILQYEQIEQSLQAVQSRFGSLFPGLPVPDFFFFFAAPTGTASTMRSVTRNVTAWFLPWNVLPFTFRRSVDRSDSPNIGPYEKRAQEAKAILAVAHRGATASPRRASATMG